MADLNMQARIHPQSPLYLVGTMVEVMRERFRPDQDIPWTWTGNIHTSSIIITTQGDPETETASCSTKLIVRRGTMGYQPLSIGDLDSRNVPALMSPGVEVTTFGTSMSISFDIVDQRLGSAEIIADLAAATIMGGRQALSKYLGLKTLGPVVIQPGNQLDEDTPKWMVSVQFPLTQEATFLTSPLSTLIKEARMNTTEGAGVRTDTIKIDR